MNRELRLYERAGDSVGRAFERTVVRHPNKVCFQFEDQAWTFEEVCKIPLNAQTQRGNLWEFLENLLINSLVNCNAF